MRLLSRLTFVAFIAFLSMPLPGQTLLVEDFTDAPGTFLTSAGWNQSGSSTVNPLAVSMPGGLAYEGYSSSGIGNAATLAATGQDVYRAFGPVVAGDLFLSFMMEVSDAGSGDYFMALSKSTSQANYFARLYAKSSGPGFVLGISKCNEADGPFYGNSVFDFNTTYLVTMRYTFEPGDSNDVLRLYVFADPYLPPEEPTPEAGPYTDRTKGDPADLGYVTLRQGSTSAAAILTIDGIKVATTWGEAPLPIRLKSFTATRLSSTGNVELRWATLSETNCFGFQIQRADNTSSPFATISEVIPGHGTTSTTQEYLYLDQNPGPAYYRLRQIDLDGSEHFSEIVESMPTTGVRTTAESEFALLQNYPNPGNPGSVIPYQISERGFVRLVIYDLLGREVAVLVSGIQEAGRHNALFDAKGVAAGAYYCRLVANRRSATKAVLVMR